MPCPYEQQEFDATSVPTDNHHGKPLSHRVDSARHRCVDTDVLPRLEVPNAQGFVLTPGDGAPSVRRHGKAYGPPRKAALLRRVYLKDTGVARF